MSWLSRLTPRGQGSRANQNTAPSSPVTADPETCLIVFQNHWRQVSWVFEQQDCRGSGVGDDLTAVQNHTDQMMCLLAEERRPGGGASTGPILELVLKENVLDRLLQWHLRRGMSPNSQRALLKLFEVLIGQCQQPLLQHKAVLQPVLCLLATCADPVLGCLPALEGSLVLLLNQVCVCMAQQPGVLELLLHATPLHAHQGPSPQLIFSLLVPFIHREGSTGQQARDALLLVMATSASNQAVARYITENSYFCQILAAGLSALYSSLPRKLDVRDDDWHALRHEDWAGVSSLVLFMNSLEFCNAVVQVSHPLVCGQLLDFIHSGFLEHVIGPALHKSSVEEMIASTAYLDLFLRSVTETDLLKTFLRFVLLDRHDDDTILDTLLTRISSNSRLCMVSLSLFRTLLSLNCEDLVLQLILRYLLPCTHVMLSQRPAVRETDMYGKSADKFLSLIPECCRLDTAPPGDREDDDTQWGRAQESPSMESAVPPKPRTQSHLALFMRQLGNGPDRTSAHPRRDSSPMTTDSRLQWVSEAAKGLDWEGQYLAYLRDARKEIELCSWGCRDWSAPYDGENPSPNSAPPPPPPPTPIPALIMVPEHFSLNPIVVSTPPPAALSAAPIPTVPSDSGQQGAEAVSPQRSSSDQDGGKWNVTIDKKCVSLTSHASKRSLQQLAPVKHEAPPPPPASTAQMPLPLASSPHHALCNGVGLGEEVPHSQDEGMEEKKLKRELSDGCSPADGGHNGATGGPPESCQVVSSVLSQGSDSQSTLSPLTVSSVQEMNSSKILEPTPTQCSTHTPGLVPAPAQSSAHTPEPIPVPTQSPAHTPEPIPVPTQSSAHTPNAIPVPAQSPAHTPEPIPVPSPDQSSTHTPDPVPAPAQSPAHTPEPVPGPAQSSAHTPEPVPGPAQSSAHTPEPIPVPIQSSAHTPDPIPVPSPDQSSTHTPDPVPAPAQSPAHTPEPVPGPAQSSAHTPEPIPVPIQSSAHTPEPIPVPSPDQSSTHTPDPVPAPAQSPAHTPDPVPAPAQSPAHTPDPIPVPSPDQSSAHTPGPIPVPIQSPAHTPKPIPDPAQSSTHTPGPVSSPDQSSANTPDAIPVPAQILSQTPGPVSVPVPTPSTRPQLAQAMSQGLESVESLIRELMDRTPISPQSEDSGGHGISIEAFHQELQELEDRVLPLREHPQDPAPGPVPASTGPEGEPAPIALDSEAKPEDSANEVFSSAHSLRLPLSQPYTGPLMGVVFAKLECMLQNSLYVNIMLTGILAKLACYPQPLLRSFLLNTNMVFQPSVKSLVQVLGSVKIRIEAFAATQENFPAMLRKARQYLVARGKLDWADPLGLNVHNLRRSDSLVKSRKTSLGNLILRHTQSPTRARQVAQQALANVHGGAQGQAEALRVKNAVYSAVVFSEFLKELAALAQEHAVAMPFPPSQGAEE